MSLIGAYVLHFCLLNFANNFEVCVDEIDTCMERKIWDYEDIISGGYKKEWEKEAYQECIEDFQ